MVSALLIREFLSTASSGPVLSSSSLPRPLVGLTQTEMGGFRSTTTRLCTPCSLCRKEIFSIVCNSVTVYLYDCVCLYNLTMCWNVLFLCLRRGRVWLHRRVNPCLVTTRVECIPGQVCERRSLPRWNFQWIIAGSIRPHFKPYNWYRCTSNLVFTG